MTAKPITSAKDLLDYLLKLQNEYDLTNIELITNELDNIVKVDLVNINNEKQYICFRYNLE